MSDKNLMSSSITSEITDFEKDIKSLAPYFEALELCPDTTGRIEIINGPALVIQYWLMENCRAFVRKYQDVVFDLAAENFISKINNYQIRSFDGSGQVTIPSKNVIKLNLTMAATQQENPALADSVKLALVMYLLPLFAEVKYSIETAEAGLEAVIFNSNQYRRSVMNDLLSLGRVIGKKKKGHSWLMWLALFIIFNLGVYLAAR